jgi:hypothetical protein
MRKFLYKLFDILLGKFARGIQGSLRKRPKNLNFVLRERAIQRSADYVMSRMNEAIIFKTREELWDYCIHSISTDQNPMPIIAEFGVWEGYSINYFAKRSPNASIFGFDSFEGLEENWSGYHLAKGTFSTGGKLPKCPANVKLFKGWYEDTMPAFLETVQDRQISILHLDSDTYKPTKFVLTSLIPNLKYGSVIIFDEYFGYPNFEQHEFLAWREIVETEKIEYRYLGFSDMQVAIEIL